MQTPDPDAASFLPTFAEWVEACWFAEHDAADRRLEAVLRLPPDTVLVGSMVVLGRLMESFATAPEDIAAALVAHLVVGSDGARAAVIRDVVLATGAEPADHRPLLARHGPEAVTRAALECASFLAQAIAEREGVVPSSIVRGL